MNFLNSNKATYYLGPEIYKNFSYAYTNILKAIAD